MATYGITFDVTSKTVQEMAKIEAAMQKLGATATKESDRVEHSVDSMSHSFERLQHRIVEVFALEKLKEFGMEILHTTAEFEGFDNRVKYASLNTIDAATNMAFLRKEVEALHLPMRQVYEGFSEMEAGLVGTGIEGQRLRNLFEGISTAAATLHLPQYQLQRTLYDLKEIGEIGLNMRIERSLGTALPGIGKIVKDTFGKSMHELQLEGLSGPAFLDKLGPALKKQFESGLAQYGESLQAKMADTSNKFTQMQIDMGEKLKPVYISIMNTLLGVMDKIGEFVGWLNNHSAALEKILRIVELLGMTWVIYKGGLMAVMALEKAHTIVLAAMTVAEYGASFGIKGMSMALGELGVNLSMVGWGIAAAGIALLVKAFYDWNTEMDKSVEKWGNLKNIGHEAQTSSDRYNELITKYQAYQKKPDNFTSGEVVSMAQGMKQLYEQQHEALVSNIQPHIDMLSDSSKNVQKYYRAVVPGAGGGYGGGFSSDSTKTPMYAKISAAADSLSSISSTTQRQMDALQKALGTSGIQKALKQGEKITYDPMSETANKSGHLSGAEGGLGQAKIINIKIDTVQKNYVQNSKDLVKHGEEAADMIIRVANNFSESQQGTY